MQVNADAGGVVLVVDQTKAPMVARRKVMANTAATPTVALLATKAAAPPTVKAVVAVVVTNRATARHTKAARSRRCPKAQRPSKTSPRLIRSRASTLSIPAAPIRAA